MSKTSREAIQQRVLQCVGECTRVEQEDIQLSHKLNEDLSIDSLDRIELCMQIETQFSTSIPDSDWEGMKEVGEIVNYLCDKLNARD